MGYWNNYRLFLKKNDDFLHVNDTFVLMSVVLEKFLAGAIPHKDLEWDLRL